MLVEARIDLHEIQGDQRSGLRNTFANEVALAQRKTTSYGGACAGSIDGIQCVDVEGEVDGCITTDPTECHVHDLADAVPISC
jgi:hypothetical protein